MTLTVTPQDKPAALASKASTSPRSHRLTDRRTQTTVARAQGHRPTQSSLTPEDLERVAQYFGEVGEDPFFGHIDGYPNICAIQRDADEKTPIFAEIFHTDWSFMAVPPAGTALFGITIPPHGGDTLFADQVKAYEEMPDELREKVEGLTAIHSAALGYAPTAPMVKAIKRLVAACRSNRARKHEKPVHTHLCGSTTRPARKRCFHPLPTYRALKVCRLEDSQALAMELYVYQTQEKFQYRHKWERHAGHLGQSVPPPLGNGRLRWLRSTVTSGHHCGHPVVSCEKIALWGTER